MLELITNWHRQLKLRGWKTELKIYEGRFSKFSDQAKHEVWPPLEEAQLAELTPESFAQWKMRFEHAVQRAEAIAKEENFWRQLDGRAGPALAVSALGPRNGSMQLICVRPWSSIDQRTIETLRLVHGLLCHDYISQLEFNIYVVSLITMGGQGTIKMALVRNSSINSSNLVLDVEQRMDEEKLKICVSTANSILAESNGIWKEFRQTIERVRKKNPQPSKSLVRILRRGETCGLI